jgi:RNA polymerase sigma factor (sigma-70 family)
MNERKKYVSMSAILNDRQLHIIQMYYQHNLTQAEIAAELGISQRHVGRIIAESLDLLRAADNLLLDFPEIDV